MFNLYNWGWTSTKWLIMIYQNEMTSLDWNTVFAPALNIFILVLFIALMLIAYYKIKRFIVVLFIFLFSIIIGILAINTVELPFNPYLPIFFILFQAIFFIMFTLEVYG